VAEALQAATRKGGVMTDDDKLPQQGNVVPFGKYKGRLIEEVLADDPAYLQWLCGQDWFRAKFVSLHQIIINRGAEPEETPEHNAIQVKFLDDDFCLRFIRYLRPNIDQQMHAQLTACLAERARRAKENIETQTRDLERLEESLRKYEPNRVYYPSKEQQQENVENARVELARCQQILTKELAAKIDEINVRFERKFEVQGVDVMLAVEAHNAPHDVAISLWAFPGYRFQNSRALRIEIKPIVGDDYPAVLRQMKRTQSDVLLVGRYTGIGATREQFVKTFATASIRVVFLEDVEAS
jgi:uncharacterized protein (DUF3820 family)